MGDLEVPELRKLILTLGSLGALSLGMAGSGCAPAAESRSTSVMTAEVLDGIETAMDRRAFGRWPSWSMRIEDGALAFRVEVGGKRGAGAQQRACSEIGRLVEEQAGARQPWRAELTQQGRVVHRCTIPRTLG